MGEEDKDKPQVEAAEPVPPEAVDMDADPVQPSRNVFEREPEPESIPAPEPEPETIPWPDPVPEAEPEAAGLPEDPEPEPAHEEPARADVFAPEPAAPPPPQQVVTEVRKGGFFPMLLGGLVAGGIGLGAGWWLFGQDQAGPDIATELAGRDDRIAALEAQIADLNATAESLAEGPDFAPLQAAIDEQAAQSSGLTEQVGALQAELGETLGGLQAGVEGLESRLTDLEQQQAGADGGLSETATAAYEREIAALREETATAVEGLTARVDDIASTVTAFESSIDAEMLTFKDAIGADLEAIRAEANAVEEMSEEAATAAAARAALADIRGAVETGAPFSEALAELQATGAAEVPEALQQAAETGTPTVRALREAFPDAARDALSAARSADDSVGPASFFERTFNIRSTEPREGDDPDAVLSRAEAAVADGQIAAALSEIAALPEPALQALSAWTAEAETRVAAETAIDELTATLTAN